MNTQQLTEMLNAQLASLTNAKHVPHDPTTVRAALGTVWRERFALTHSSVKGYVFLDLMLIDDEGLDDGHYALEFNCAEVDAIKRCPEFCSVDNLIISVEHLQHLDEVILMIVRDVVQMKESTPCN